MTTEYVRAASVRSRVKSKRGRAEKLCARLNMTLHEMKETLRWPQWHQKRECLTELSMYQDHNSPHRTWCSIHQRASSAILINDLHITIQQWEPQNPHIAMQALLFWLPYSPQVCRSWAGESTICNAVIRPGMQESRLIVLKSRIVPMLKWTDDNRQRVT